MTKSNVNYFQIGRTLIECTVKDPSRCCNLKALCSKKARRPLKSRKH